jgi:uncharacterized membrane protein
VLRNFAIALASIGLLDSIYLTWIKVANQEAVCAGIGSCEAVNSSEYATLAGIPVALFGAGAFLAILLLLFFEESSPFLEANSLMLVFGISLAGVLYSIYLTYIELYVLKAICPFCVLSAVSLLGLLFATSLRLRQQWSEY